MKKDKKKRLKRLAKKREERKSFGHRRPSRDQIAEELLRGIITITPSGFGFVRLDNSENDDADVFIPPHMLKHAMDGDKVELILLPERDDRGPAGRVVRILEHARQSIVGEVVSGHWVRPISRKINTDIAISGKLHGAKRGDWVKIKLIHSDRGDIAGEVTKTLGKSGSIKNDLDAICAEYNLEPPYSEKDDVEAANIVPRSIPRKDMRGDLTVTIDPTDAKDFDDALSLASSKDGDYWELGVHISDVAAVIEPKSKWDKMASKRSFTAYLPGRTLPMLPKSLTAKISLHTGEDCPAHTVIFKIEKATSKIVSYKRCHSLIRVDYRLNYEEVQEFLDSREAPSSWSCELAALIDDLHAITSKMRKRRIKKEHFIDLAMPEIRVMCDEGADTVSGLSTKIQRDSEFIVEECMLAANSAVGEELVRLGVAGIYRTHPEPDPDKLMEFSDNIMDSFGIKCGDISTRGGCSKFISSLPDSPLRPIVLNMLLRSLTRATYKEKPELHYGLGKECYCHFTSPIRRYPDLTVHQQLWNYDMKYRVRSAKALASVAQDCAAKEENNDNAYFAASDRLKLRYLLEQLEVGRENRYVGYVVKISHSGILADIPELGLYGFVPKENLWQRNSAPEFKCGDILYLKLSQIDPVRGQTEFSLIKERPKKQ